MKNSMKLAAAVSAAALMVMGTSFVSMAATGWVNENGNWRYYDRDGSYVTDEWRKSSDTSFYLDENGYMATDQLIEDGDNYYAVDASGAMVKNAWRELTDSDGETNWYYFQDSGKAKDDGFLTIEGEKYHFTDGKMDSGWIQVNDDTYLLNKVHDGTFGKVVTGWAYVDDFDDDDDVSATEEGWYYFSTNGKMVSNDEKKINGFYYVFDENGLMLDNWVEFTAASSSNAVYKYYTAGDGARVNGWRYLDDMSDDEGLETDEGWYYFKNGLPYTADYKTTYIAEGYGVAKISGKIYCFDDLGKMVTGKVESDDGTYFYFDEDESDGSMKYGRVKIEDSDDLDDGIYYFADKGSVGEKGESITGVKKGFLYENGELVCADDGMKYEVVTVDGKQYLVNENGKVKTSGTVKDGDDQKWKVEKDSNGDYIITKVD